MQTFLPYDSFDKSASCLDYRRLGKQRVECKQIITALEDKAYGWQNHPAVKMWRSYNTSLAHYGAAICREWRSRGYRDTLLPFFTSRIEAAATPRLFYHPHWLGDPGFHASHRSNLLRKDPEYYSQFNWCEPDDLEYVWPKEVVCQ